MTRDRHAQDEDPAGSERELKFLADAETLRRVLAAPTFGGGEPSPAWRKLRTVYFDTDAGDLSRARVALRVRHSDDGRVMGLKRASADGGAFEREETEVAVASAEPDLSLFPKALARDIARLTGGAPLAPRFGSDIARATRTVAKDGAEVEIAFDDGFLFAGERRAPTQEIELELKSGPPSVLFDLGLDLVEAFPVRLGVQSKAERAHALLDPRPPQPVHANEPALRAGMSLDRAVAVVLHNCLGHILGNLPALEGGDRVEAVHQMRVGVRRLRSAMDLFGEAFPSAGLDALRAEARRIGTALGGARDWDVFVGRLRTGALARFSSEPGFDSLIAAAEAKAAAGHSAVVRLVDDKTIARFALAVERLAAARAWRDGCGADALAALDGPVEAFAAGSLDRLDRKLRKRGRRFQSLAPEARHRLRIAVKHMRYATEFFGALFDADEAERFAGKACALQDALGDLNDAAIALRLVEELAPRRAAGFARASGLVAGWCARESEGDADALGRDWRRLVKTSSSWRKVYERQAESV
ncbi:inorganic triphosphatase YgiF [Roseiarcus fermentans]|uniref:Inorganic triphosphatase YgiF n=1 Tax=Roseiarcus fermentans TaxID=1473586 RepID=A0A366FBC2_9HYPH|nr:CYTH and CHAD domain-containing protein [Roseiarcus fermentans]RBP11938.1 inorganic triphosphatase YgiF [Roseiarcus fermentans]